MKFEVRDGLLDKTGLAIPDIVEGLGTGKIQFSSEVQLEGDGKWYRIFEQGQLAEAVAEKLLRPAPTFNYNSLFSHWVIKNNTSPRGYFTLIEIVKLYQEKVITGESQLRHPMLSDWQSFQDIGIFSKMNLQALYHFTSLREIFADRRFPRFSTQQRVQVMAEESVIEGLTWSLSEGGIGFLTDESTHLAPGDFVAMTIFAANGEETIEAQGEVINV
ncbi:MAG: PilZ domain-containing protein, partial [Pseudomonadota bacterium]